MGEYKFYLKQVAAFELVEKMLNVVLAVSPNCNITHFNCNTNSGALTFLGSSAAIVASTLKERPEFKTPLSLLTARPFLDVINFALSTNDGFNFSVGTDKGFHIRLHTSGNRENNFNATTPITDALNAEFNLLRHQEATESALPEAERNALQTARTILLDFSNSAAHLSQLSASNTEKLNDLLIAKTTELDRAYQQKTAELHELHASRVAELDEREEVFRKDKAKLDARENTVVRRDLLAKIETILGNQRKIEITNETLQKRQPVKWLCLIAMTVGLSLVGAFGYKALADEKVNVQHVVPLSTGMVLFVSTAIFFIRWNDAWFKEHANAEFENRKFYLDTVRASWIAELLFEWKDKKDVPFPEQLIDRYTTGLFQSGDIIKTTKHPFDDLKSLAGSVSEIKFSKKDGVSLKRKATTEQDG